MKEKKNRRFIGRNCFWGLTKALMTKQYSSMVTRYVHIPNTVIFYYLLEIETNICIELFLRFILKLILLLDAGQVFNTASFIALQKCVVITLQ